MNRVCTSSIVLLIILSIAVLTFASEGDQSPDFQSCCMKCFHIECQNKAEKQLTLANLLEWSCQDQCKYKCMWQNVEKRRQDGTGTVKFYGKWPFVKVMGMQELFSTVFSIANAVPHIYYLFEYRRRIPKNYVYRSLWSAYSIVNINTWIWSAVFHAKDNVVTERLDYWCASMGIVFASCCAACRILKLKSIRGWAAVFVPWMTLLALHIAYLHFIHFDYGYNMKVSLASGVIYSALWNVHCLRNPRPFNWKMYVVTILLWAAAMLEIFDFPPWFDLLDAHAMWHGLTPPLTVLFYSFLIDDAEQDQKFEKII